MGSTLGPNSGPRAGVILTHPNSFPFPFLGSLLFRTLYPKSAPQPKNLEGILAPQAKILEWGPPKVGGPWQLPKLPYLNPALPVT
jgi:hypothetical protein